MAYQYTPIDLPSAFLAAQQAKNAQQQNTLMQMEQEERERRLQAMRRGEMSSKEQIELERGRLDVQKTKSEIARSAVDEHLRTNTRTAKAVVNSIDIVRKNPAAYPMMKERLAQGVKSGTLALDISQLPETAPQPQELEQLRNVWQSIGDESASPKMTDDITETFAGLGLNPADKRSWESPEFQKAMQIKGQGKVNDPVMKLRQEWQGQQVYKDTQQLAAAYEKAQSASETSVGDISLIYSYMKIVDPGARVTDSDYSVAQYAGSLPDRLLNAYYQMKSGTKLESNRELFKAEIKKLMESQMKRYNAVADNYRKEASAVGADPDRVVFPFGRVTGFGGKAEATKTAQANIPQTTATAPIAPAEALAQSKQVETRAAERKQLMDDMRRRGVKPADAKAELIRRGLL